MDCFGVRRLRDWKAEGMDGCVNGWLWGYKSVGVDGCLNGWFWGWKAAGLEG